VASCDTQRKLTEHPEWIAPRSDARVFLGEPGAPEATKTTVEPGNAFSPGMATFGVTWWLRFPDRSTFFAPELAPLNMLAWSYEDGYLPLIHCHTRAEGLSVRHSLFQDGTAAARSEAVCARLTLTNPSPEPRPVQVFVALRSLGPAGGPLPALRIAPDSFGFWSADRTLPLLSLDQPPDAIGCGIGDPSPLAREGRTPAESQARDPDGWCFGLARYDLTLSPDGGWQVNLDCPHQTYGNLQEELPGTASPCPALFTTRAESHLTGWRERLRLTDLTVPDDRFRHAYFAGLQHLLTASVGDQARIAPLAYPLPWLRDSVFIIRCLDLAGFHQTARAMTEHCARNDFFGGFGPEGDAPGQGIWALVQHYRLTGDHAWLQSVYPAIQRKVDWLVRMRRADRPLQVVADTPTLAFTHAERASGYICLPAQDGVIMGTMDHGVASSVGWVNHWALCGLRAAADAARALEATTDAATYDAEAAALRTALLTYAERNPEFFRWDRTVNSLLWPTRAWEDEPAQIEKGFDAWWQTNRGTAAHFKPEPYWLYFEAAQAHNALLLGQRDRAWQALEYRLRRQDAPGLYGWREGRDGVGTKNAVLGGSLLDQLRGCQIFDSIMPHGWSQAEIWLLQRAMLVEEWQGALLLFAGIPPSWLTPGTHLGFTNFPTWYGVISAELTVDAAARSADIALSGVAVGTRLRIALPGRHVDAVAEGDALHLHVDLSNPPRSPSKAGQDA